jgi:hypothetical protein
MLYGGTASVLEIVASPVTSTFRIDLENYFEKDNEFTGK